MIRRTGILLLVGVLIIGGAMASTAVQLECERCSGDGKIECPACGGFGAVLSRFPFWVECACRGEDRDCPVCGGDGGYLQFAIGPCLLCDGKGWATCSRCGGDGRIGANELLLELLNLKSLTFFGIRGTT